MLQVSQLTLLLRLLRNCCAEGSAAAQLLQAGLPAEASCPWLPLSTGPITPLPFPPGQH